MAVGDLLRTGEESENVGTAMRANGPKIGPSITKCAQQRFAPFIFKGVQIDKSLSELGAHVESHFEIANLKDAAVPNEPRYAILKSSDRSCNPSSEKISRFLFGIDVGRRRWDGNIITHSPRNLTKSGSRDTVKRAFLSSGTQLQSQTTHNRRTTKI